MKSHVSSRSYKYMRLHVCLCDFIDSIRFANDQTSASLMSHTHVIIHDEEIKFRVRFGLVTSL